MVQVDAGKAVPEIVEDGVTGLLADPGDTRDLADKIRYLWDRPDLCRQMGLAGRGKALREYSSDRYYQNLMTAYDLAIRLGPGGSSTGLGQDGRCRNPDPQEIT